MGEGKHDDGSGQERVADVDTVIDHLAAAVADAVKEAARWRGVAVRSQLEAEQLRVRLSAVHLDPTDRDMTDRVLTLREHDAAALAALEGQ